MSNMYDCSEHGEAPIPVHADSVKSAALIWVRRQAAGEIHTRHVRVGDVRVRVTYTQRTAADIDVISVDVIP